MADPLFWLALSFLLVVASLTAVLVVAIPALRELGRAARSAEKFFDTLGRELPPTLEAIRLTGLEITELTDDVTEGVQGAGQVVQQVNQSLTSAQSKAKTLNTGTKSLLAGAGAAWRAWTKDSPPRQRQRDKPSGDPRRLKTAPAASRNPLPAPTQRATEDTIAGQPAAGSRPPAGLESTNGLETGAFSASAIGPKPNASAQDSHAQRPRGEDPFYTATPDLTLEEASSRADSAPAAERWVEPPPQQQLD